MVPTVAEKSLLMQLAHIKYRIRELVSEWEKDAGTLGPVASKYNRYFSQVLERRLALIEKELASIRYIQVD